MAFSSPQHRLLAHPVRLGLLALAANGLVLARLGLPLGNRGPGRALRAIPGLTDTPIMAITSYAMTGDREKALLQGFTEYIEKPINPETFSETISALL